MGASDDPDILGEVTFEATPQNKLERLHSTFHFDYIADLMEYQDRIGLMKFIRQPFSEEFSVLYGDSLDLLTEDMTIYDDDLEDRMYENDDYLAELVIIRQRHERRKGDDNHWVEPEEVAAAFWTRRNLLAYMESLVREVETAYDNFPEGESSQQAS